ncbi:hypothetical protein C0J52_25958 [Blattella germanica]|nr:hypothetical protein C0J52_25958 [Blattella germanica]
MVVSQSCTVMFLAWETIEESRREWREESKLWIQKMWHFPPNREEVLNRLCSRIQEKENEMIQQNVSNSFLEHMIRKRTEVIEKSQVLDVQSSSHTNIPAQPQADTSTPKKPGRKFVAAETETSDESDVSVVYAESNDSWEEESESEV